MNGKKTLRFAASLMAVLVALSPTMSAHAADSSTPVKVTNSDNSPVVTQDVGQSASQMVYLYCIATCAQYALSGPQGQEFVPEYTVPSNRYLVITAADAISYDSNTGGPCATSTRIVFGTKIGDFNLGRFGWTLSPNAQTAHFTYPPGFALAAGTSVVLQTSGCAIEVNLYGYLTAK
ncbi:MAG: hypothetical protein WCC26_10580 [Terracidiphilus sp.]